MEEGSEESPLGGDRGCTLVGHGTRNPENREGMAEREGVRGKLGQRVDGEKKRRAMWR